MANALVSGSSGPGSSGSWARHFTLAVPLSTQVTGEFNAGVIPTME